MSSRPKDAIAHPKPGDRRGSAGSPLDRACHLLADRLAQVSELRPETSGAGIGLLPFDLVDDDALRQALAASGLTLDGEPLCLLDPRSWVNRIPRKPTSTHDLDLLSAHQWQRYGQGARNPSSPVHVLAMWRQRLRRLAEAAGDKTLLGLLAHSQPAHDGASTVFDAATRSHDACSTPYPISADAFVTLAASVGLFSAEPPSFTRDPDGVVDRALYSLSRRDYSVRFARATDIAALARLEERCWIAPLRTPRPGLLARLERYPEGQCVLERDGQVRGVIYSQRIRDESELGSRTMDDVHELHDPCGDVVQLLAVNIDPEIQNRGCGDQLLEFMLQRASLQRGVRKIVAVTLCKDFRAGQGLPFREYVTGPGSEHDRVLHFHHAHGARIAAILPGYRPRDVANEGNGVLVAYDPMRRRPGTLARETCAPEVEAPRRSHEDGNAEVLAFVMETVAALVGSPQAVDPDRPLMESGLDSAGLLILKSKLEARFGRHLQQSFLFSHNTPRKVVDFFCVEAPAGPTSLPMPGATPERASAVDARDVAGDIAIVGLACRLPDGIHDLDALWDVLDASRDVIGAYPSSRGEWPRGGAIERGGFLADGECFDAAFFRMSRREAEVTDPQQRLLLEVSWACFEDACIPPAALRGTDTGVFVGASNSDYAHLLQEAGAEVEAHAAVGNSLAVLANRLSYFYDFNGPSLLIDTACSASMVALHTAVQSLRAGECGLALVGGVNFICHPRISLSYQRAGMLSPDGRCKVFDDSANGYVRSEGVVTLLLKPLGEAIADGNRIHAVIRGSAVNHGGQAAGLTVPNPQRQAALLTSAWRDARVSPRDITYLEAHGTGTSLGDPIEIEGMQSAFAASLPVSSPARCGVGSIKTNIGHLESAAGLAGVLKVVASMAHRRLPASLHVATLNSRMSLSGSPLHVQVEAQEWDAPGPRLAGVSSFGSGGANAHVVLQEHVAAGPEDAGAAIGDAFPDGQLFVLSATDEIALRHSARAVVAWLRRRPSSSRFVDAMHTWQCGRTAFRCRLAAHVSDFDDLARKLEGWLDGGDHDVATARIDGDARGDDVEWNAALARRDWLALARLWLQGSEGRWSDLYAALPARPRFLSVPGQAFEKTRYWVSSPPASARSPLEAVPAEETQFMPDVTASGTHASHAPSAGEHDVLLAVPVWRPLDDEAATDRPRADRQAFQRHVVLLCDLGVEVGALASALDRIAPRGGDRLCIALTALGRDVAERYEDITRQCFERLRELARDPSTGKVLVQCVFADAGEGQMFRGLSGLLRTLAMEQSRFIGQVVGVEGNVEARTLATRLHALESRPTASLVRWQRERAHVLDWDRLEPGAHAGSVYKDGGVYVITGGLGALGRLFAADIVARCPRATVVLTGRSPWSDAITQQLEALGGAQARLAYRQLDLQDAAAVSTLFEDLRTRYGAIHGVIHCAGTIADSLIVKKSSPELEATLLPKVTGTWHLDLASRHLDLDFFVVFSSFASAMGNIGQADYAAANGFMDHFVHHRRELARRGQRHGASVSIHWPYWRDGGMRIDAATLSVLQQTIGMRPMATEVGLSAFHMAVAMDLPRMLVAQGDPEPFLSRLRGGEAIPSAMKTAPPAQGALSLDTIQKTLRDMLADVLRARPEDLELRKPLVELGLDSVLGTEFVSAINRRFSTSLSSVGIYDHPTLMALAQYVDATQPKYITPIASVHEPAVRNGTSELRAMQDAAGRGSLATQDPDEKIAVIGMSGRYPQAKNLAAYWRNLVAGRNAIVEIPDSRWDTAGYYDADPDAEGKMYCRWMGVLDDADAFDPRFFRITPQEALYMDPEQRLFLQESYRALEDAGYSGDIADGLNCGVYLGMESSGYGWHFAGSPRVSETITGNHSAIAASRLAYFLNLKGPALAVDTACSSSLVATHLACQALRSGEVDMALAGGVRLWLSPVMHIGMSKARMLSPTGQCRTFDDAADGIVMSEGVGAVVLKRLSDAERDGDNIHGVILASGINQDGRTNGITAPSVKSQIALERRIYREYGIDPESISYIEAHGTGTKLGDPIELQALATVFSERTQREQFCALGSVKTNIGHAAAAAGVAGLHKVLLCLKHASLVPTLNVEKENRHFDFGHSPFYVNREYKPWMPAFGGTRRAGLSSFGFSGTNAHLVVEEYVAPLRHVAVTANDEQLILLSARNAAQLEQKARDLLDFVEHEPTCKSGDAGGVSNFLRALAQTLQVGRAAMEERAAFVAGSLDDLKAGLRTLGGQPRETVDVQRGRCVEDEGILGLWNTDEDLRATATKWLRERRLSKLLGLWIKGVEFDWRELYGGAHIARISLPTYPFAEERFWVDRRAQTSRPDAAPGVDRLHPLVHRNVSDLGRQAYRTTLSSRAFFLDDHRVNGARVLPGVAYLEMARAAIALALPEEHTQALEFLDHAWAQPVVVDGDVELTIVLHDDGVDADGERRIDYEFLTEADTGDTLHCRGSVRCHAHAPEREVVDVASLEDAIDRSGNAHPGYDRDTLYRRFKAIGMHYGPSMQGIVDLRTDGREVLAHLRLPEGQDAASEDYVLHPSMMDAAMQCTICLLANLDAGTASAVMPFTFDEMRVHAGTGREMLVWVRPSAEASSDASGTLDVDLMDTDGAPCVSLRGLVTRAVPQASARPPAPLDSLTLARGEPRAVVRSAPVTDAKLTPRLSANLPAKPTLRALLPIWNPVPPGADTVTPDEGERCLLLGGDETLFDWLRPALADLRQVPVAPDASIEAIRTALSASSFDHLLWFAPDVDDADAIVSDQNNGVLSLFRIIKALTQLDQHERELKLTVVTFGTQQVFDGDPVSPHHAGVHGMIGSIAKELPLWRIRLLDLESADDLDAREILALPWDEKGSGLAHRGGEWLRQEFAEVRLSQTSPAGRRNGTYVVIGGAGGLGEVWTRHMVARYDANVVWIGRRPLDGGIEAKLDAIAAIGPRPHYIAADAADEAALAAAIDRVRSLFPKIDGVVHSALVLKDQSIRGMDEAAFRQSLATKVDVSVNLEKVFRADDLDFVLFFSSLSSFSRSAGQSNYCAGCTFKDSFAHAMRATQPYPVKVVNWGYWGSVGIAADEFYRKRMERQGLGSIEPADAMDALERFVASDMNQLVLMDVISDAAFDDLPVSEEIRHYPDLEMDESAMSVAS